MSTASAALARSAPGAEHARERVALVTGAASGIGRATAQRLLDDGHAVVCADVDARRLTWVGAEERAAAVAADISSPEGNAAMVAAAIERFGALDILILNAGVVHIGPFAALDTATVDRVLDVNLRGVVLGLHAALPALQRGSSPSVITVASISGMQGEPAMALYSASKGGVISFSRSAAVELGPHGIRVNCVCPGPTVTGMTQSVLDVDPRIGETVRRNVPLKRLAAPEEIAEVVAFLASPAASFVNGAVIPVDGGLTANVGQYPPPDLMEATR